MTCRSYITGAPKRVADILVQALIDMGVDHFFGVIGGPISPVFDAILMNPLATVVQSRQESGAAFAAMGYHRTSGRVPCVLVTAGPGATNLITGVAAADAERTPMVILAGDVAWAVKGGRLLQDSGPQGLNIEHLFDGVTRGAFRIRQPKSAVCHLIQALELATNPSRSGPVLVVVPIDQASVVTSSPSIVNTSRVHHDAYRVQTEAVIGIRDKILNAKRPLLVLGAGCRPYVQSIETLLAEFKVPFITTPRAKGVVSESHSCSLRHGGLAASVWAREYCRRGVDLAVVLGTDLDDCSIGQTPYVSEGGELIHVDLDASVFNRNLPTTLGIVADIDQFINTLTIATYGKSSLKLQDEVIEIKAGTAFDIPTFETCTSSIITPYRALADLQVASPNARFVTDIGEHMLFALHYLTSTDSQKFTIHLGIGSMGSGIGSSIGLSLADPSTRVICVCGDGGMQMNGMEVLTAKMHQLPILFAVFNDSRYNMVHHGYNQVYGREASFETPLIDFRDWGRSMGVSSERIHHPGEITSGLLDVLMQDGPAILDIRIDRSLRMVGGGRNEALQRMSQSANGEV
jgi:acetolactate synthase I/II/III large subunit